MKNQLKYRAVLSLLFCLSGLLSLSAQQPYTKVAGNNCGVAGAQPFLVEGDNYEWPGNSDATAEARTCNFGHTLVYAFDKLDIQADYRMELLFWADAERTIQIKADGNPVCAPITIPAGEKMQQTITLPKKAFAYGQLVLVFEATKGPNAVVSQLNISSTNPTPLLPFAGDSKEALKKKSAFVVDTDVDVEAVLPRYAPKPDMVSGVYNPVLSLNGVWQFSEKEAGDAWHPIQVPGQWSMQGFTVDSAGWGRYKTSFTLPKDWKGKRVMLRFDGVHSEYIVYVNGKEAGSHLGGMTAYEINLNSLLRAGANELSLKVRSESLADMLGSLTQYAAHQLGGITRKVTLFALPEIHMEDMRVVTDLDATYTDATLKVYTTVTNASTLESEDVSVHLSLDRHTAALEYKLPKLAAGATWSGWLEVPVARPELWTSERPALYTLSTELYVSGSVVEKVRKRIGFREVEVRGNRLLVNGVPVKLRGVCRHEAHPLTGRVLTLEQQRKDVELYRDANCNFIRTSHYPPAEEMVELCDELGMFVEVEAPVCWIGHHANENWKVLDYRDPSYYRYVLQANMETMHFYRNHASVIFWSMANESYWNREFAQVQEYVKKADATRPHTFHDQAYGGFNNQGSTASVSNFHYPGPNGYKEAAKSDRPMVYGEYCHLNVYNRSELVTDPGVRSDWALALAPTWENMYTTDGVLGGSIWSGIDDIFQLPGGDAVGYGPWGPIDGWRRPKPEYWDMKKIYSPIRVLTTGLSPSTSLRVELENRYTYTNMRELKIYWSYGQESGIAHAEIEPGQRGSISLAVARPEDANELRLTFIDPRGFVADEYLLPVGKQMQNEWPEKAEATTRLKQTKSYYLITGDGFECRVDKTNGQIESLKQNGREVISGGPWLMALPLNGGGCYPNHNANTPLFNDLCSEWKVVTTTAEKVGNDVVINVSGSYKEFTGSYAMTINAAGKVSVFYTFNALQDVNPRQWGLVFDTPSALQTTFWRREGMWNVYPADHISRSVGEASLFYDGVPSEVHPRTEPAWSWSLDSNELGSNDFRSTRRNIWYAGLKAADRRVVVRSNGKQHWRSWLAGDKVRFLVADFVTAGNEMFLDSYYAPYRKPLKTGDTIEGTIHLEVE